MMTKELRELLGGFFEMRTAKWSRNELESGLSFDLLHRKLRTFGRTSGTENAIKEGPGAESHLFYLGLRCLN